LFRSAGAWALKRANILQIAPKVKRFNLIDNQEHTLRSSICCLEERKGGVAIKATPLGED
jgi:hypothetical protein